MGFLCKEKLNRIFSPLVLSGLFVTAFFVWLYNAYGIFYLSNDDTGIMKTYSGYATGEPTAYHAYGSYTLGLFFKALYTIAPMLNWYTYGSILVVIISNAVIISCIYKMRNKDDNKLKYLDFLIIGILVIAIGLYGINRISWTMNAVFAAAAGVMLLLTFLEMSGRRWRLYAAAVCFFTVSMLIRNASYKAVLPFALLVIVCHTAKGLEKPFLCRQNAGKLAICFLLMLPLLAVYGYNRIDVGIKQQVFPNSLDSFEHYRGLFTDSYHIPYEGNEEFYQSIGWDAEFYDMTRSWFFIDPRFNTENLKTIAEKSLKHRTETVEEGGSIIYWDEFKSATEDNPVREAMTIAVVLLLLFGMVMLVYALMKRKGWQDWALIVCAQLLAIAEWGWLVAGRGRFIDRAFYCAVLPALFTGLWVIAKNAAIMEGRKVLYVLAGIIAIWGIRLTSERNISIESAESTTRSSQISVDADRIAFNHPENLYISDTSIAGGVFLFLDMNLTGCGKNRMLWGGTGVFSKPFYKTIGRFGYEEFYSENLFDDNVYYMTTNADIDGSAFMAYMKKTFGDSVTAEVVETSDSGIYIYDMKR